MNFNAEGGVVNKPSENGKCQEISIRKAETASVFKNSAAGLSVTHWPLKFTIFKKIYVSIRV